MLSRESIKEFQEIYKKEFNEEIDEATAREKAGRLLNLIRVIYQPIKDKNYENSKLSDN